MVEIIIEDNQSNIKTEGLQIFIEGGWKLKKEGAEAPTINVTANKQTTTE